MPIRKPTAEDVVIMIRDRPVTFIFGFGIGGVLCLIMAELLIYQRAEKVLELGNNFADADQTQTMLDFIVPIVANIVYQVGQILGFY